MRPERNNHGLLSPFTGRRDHGIQKVTVPKMDTVKKARGYNHFTSSKSCLCGISGFLAYILAAT